MRFETTAIRDMPRLDVESLRRNRGIELSESLRAAFRASDRGLSNLDSLFAGAPCVTTGQQPGLFTGPLYTIYKALSALALAQWFEHRLQEPVVPVFWVAGDDHDLGEANHFFLLNSGHKIERVALADRSPGAPMLPLYREKLGQGVREAIETLSSAAPDTEFKGEVLAWLERHYTAENDYARSFAGAMAELLGPLGLVIFDPSHPAAKAVMAPKLATVLRGGALLDQALVHRSRDLVARGLPAPVRVGDGLETVMFEGALGRDRLVVMDGHHVARRSSEKWSQSELEVLLEREPERFSPNVLLRPAVEAAILPTLAYVGGPGELDYLPQCDPLFEALDVAPQGRVPRFSARVVEARVAKVLDKYGLTAEQLAEGEGRAEATLVRDDMPSDAEQALRGLRHALQIEYGRLEGAAASIDPTLRKPVQSAHHSALAAVDSLEKKLLNHLKKRNETLVQQVGRARTALFPLGRPQERVLNVTHFLVRYGREFLEAALEEAVGWYGVVDTRSGAT